MIRFIDIHNGRVYNGDMPYIHFFEDQQSIDLIYVKKLCVLSDTEYINVEMPENEAFRILDVSKMCDENTLTINQITYQDLNNLMCNSLSNKGVQYGEYWVHMLYFSGSYHSAAEVRQEFTINDVEFMLGADFYEEREELKINLGNQGTEIPESIQKAIYPANVKEEGKDNILMNRKYKELLMDYMDILGNKGSYSSLVNSLHWFEYGDLLKIKEFWKHSEWNKVIYNDQEFTQVLAERSKHILTNFAKTTYVGIYLAMQEEQRNSDSDGDGDVVYEKETYGAGTKYGDMTNARLDKALDKSLEWSPKHGSPDTLLQIGTGDSFITHHPSEYSPMSDGVDDHEARGANWKREAYTLANYERLLAEPVPALKNASYIWSRLDLSIKMALLGNFYETYFMPIHLDLIHSTIEDIVYTNAIKVIPGGTITRVDYVENFTQVSCNIKDGQVFLLGDVEVQANNNTSFAVSWRGVETKTIAEPSSQSGDGSAETGIPWFDTTAGANEVTREYNAHNIIGVDDEVSFVRSLNEDDEVKTFAVNYYSGVGVVVPMKFTIPCSEGDFIHRTSLYKLNDRTGATEYVTYSTIYSPTKEDPRNIHIDFNLLCTKDTQYDIRLQFWNSNGQTYVISVKFNVVDNRRIGLKVYKLRASNRYQPLQQQYEQCAGRASGDHVFSHYNLSEVVNYYAQFKPAEEGTYLNETQVPVDYFYETQFLRTKPQSKGARLNNIIVIKGNVVKDINGQQTKQNIFEVMSKDLRQWIELNYYIYDRHTVTLTRDSLVEDRTDINFYIFISKEYEFKPDARYIANLKNISPKEKIVYRNEWIYVPQFHYLEPMSTNTLQDYKVGRNETLCVIPDAKFLKYISEYEWKFYNASTMEYIDLNSIKEPIIAAKERREIPVGYYDIIFRYKLSSDPSGQVHEIKLDSAFIQTNDLY